MNNKVEPAEDDDTVVRGKRGDDMRIKAFGVEVQASGRSVILILIAIALIGLLYYHDYKSDNWNRVIHEGLWVQTLILATPEKDRKVALRKSAESSTIPDSVRSKIGP